MGAGWWLSARDSFTTSHGTRDAGVGGRVRRLVRPVPRTDYRRLNAASGRFLTFSAGNPTFGARLQPDPARRTLWLNSVRKSAARRARCKPGSSAAGDAGEPVGLPKEWTGRMVVVQRKIPCGDRFGRVFAHDIGKVPPIAAAARIPDLPPRSATVSLPDARAWNFARVAVHAPSPATVQGVAQSGVGGSGGPLPYLGRIQPAFGSHDLSQVSAHQGSRARAAARSIAARAYTFDNQVVFGGAPDLHTAAHEAAHIVQQRAGVRIPGGLSQPGDAYERQADAVAQEVVQGRSAEALLDEVTDGRAGSATGQQAVVQRAPIPTDFGEFDTTKYNKLGPAGSEYGVEIELTFNPDKTKVDARKIGLTQAVRSQLAGGAVAIEPARHTRLVPSGTGQGFEIDRTTMGAYANPLYAADAPGAKDKLGDTPTVAGWGQHGWHYTDKAGSHHQIAILKDTPSLPGRGKDAGQTFETTALGVEGTQSGVYMGSVTWGWAVDAAGKFSQLPLTLKSKGKPSAEFAAAAKQWNKWTTAGTVKTSVAPTNVYDATYSVAFTVAKDTEVSVSGGSYIHADVLYSPVTIVSGKDAGKSGRIKVNDLKDVGGGRATIKLPIP